MWNLLFMPIHLSTKGNKKDYSNLFLVWDQSGICNSKGLKMRAIQRVVISCSCHLSAPLQSISWKLLSGKEACLSPTGLRVRASPWLTHLNGGSKRSPRVETRAQRAGWAVRQYSDALTWGNHFRPNFGLELRLKPL